MNPVFFSVFMLLSSLCMTVTSTSKVTYEWFANLTAGSLLPTEHLSQYFFVAQITIYVTDSIYVFQIENINLTDEYINKEVLLLPFKVSYIDDDVKFYSDDKDEVWSLNMKKSLATLFQLKRNVYEEGAFAVKENNTYGTCDVEYITVKLNSSMKITKLINEASCTNSPHIHRSNTPFFECPSSFQEGKANYNEKLYTLLKNQSPYISEISSISSIHFQPFQALAEAYYIQVSQFLRITNIENEVEPILFKTMLNSNITYTSTLIHDPNSGHFPNNKTMLKVKIYQLLENLTESLDWKLSTNNLDNQTSFHILELMSSLEINDWEELYQMISVGTSYTQEIIQHFFWEFVPQVGSESSIIFIKKLITSKKVNGFSAAVLLVTFPLHMKEISKQFLIESEEFLHLTDADVQVKNSGILSFSILVQKVCNTTTYCTNELVDRYTKYFLDKFMETTDYQERMIYLQSLSNMRLPRTPDFLSPIIINPAYGKHTRYLAIWCTLPILRQQFSKAIEIYWPIFLNVSEPLEIRASAMALLIIIQPSESRLLTFFWHVKTESNYHLYNFFYTTIHSYANTKYPCYFKLRHMASQLSRYLFPRTHRWSTGNYILDYEDSVHGYGGLMQFFIIASETTGLPSTFFISTEQHSHGLSSKFSLHVKLEGITDTVWKTLLEITNTTGILYTMNITEFFQNNNFMIKDPEEVHVEIIVRIDDNTVFCEYVNASSFSEILLTIERASALYYEFSVNYQRIRFPIRYEVTKLTDLGTPISLQIQTSSLLSLRGRIKQEKKGELRQADLDFRYSMNTVTSLKTLNFLNGKWYGADRIRSLHFRVPFSTRLQERKPKSFFSIIVDHHDKGSSNGSTYGFVWHSAIKLFPSTNEPESVINNGNNSNQWFIESRDLGARFNIEVFECQGDKNIFDTLIIIKEAFQLSNKNYKMVTGGVPILGLYSLANYFTFIPPGDSCGLIISMTPLQVQIALVREGWTFHLTMLNINEISRTWDQKIWELTMYYKDSENEGVKKIDFLLEHSNLEKNLTISNTSSWRLIQFEGYLVIPSYRQGILKALRPVEGEAKISWGHVMQATSIEFDLKSDNKSDVWPANCENDTANCLQIASKITTEQTVFLNCINLPIWLTTVLLSIFPENVQADKTSTKIQFSLPTKFPWTTQGQCVINSNKILNFDNGTILAYQQKSNCYSIAVADCSLNSQFIVAVKKSPFISNSLELKIVSAYNVLIITSIKNGTKQLMIINETEVEINNVYQLYPKESNTVNFQYQFKYWEKGNMIEIVVGHAGLIIQYYGSSVVAIAEFKLRGKLCGICGNFNGQVNDEDTRFESCIAEINL